MSIRKLASETAVYGLSSIVGRALYFLLTPLYTALFDPKEMGAQSHVYSLLAFLMVLGTLRLDVAYFRSHGEEDEAELLGTNFLSMALLSGLLGLGLAGFSGSIAELFGYPHYRWLLVIAGGILFFDALCELPLARLRMLGKPWRFAAVRLTGIAVNLGLNLFWLVLLPRFPNAPAWLVTPTSGIGYIFLANIVSSALVFWLLLPELRGMQWHINWPLLKRQLRFSLPLVLVGISYIINEMLDRQLLPLVWPGGHDQGLDQLGVYSANYKLAVLLALFTQAFRYGAEPFFFRQRTQLDARTSYARVARYFLIAALLGFLIVSLFMPVFSRLFLRADSFRQGSDVVPILLAANVCLGMYYNFSVWYKVTDSTRFGAYIGLGGAALTVVLNLLLIPYFGFYGCAWTTLICYGSMMVAAYRMGQNRYRVPYALRTLIGYGVLAVGLVIISYFVGPRIVTPPLQLALDGSSLTGWTAYLLFNGFLLLIFAGVIFLQEIGNFRRPQATVSS